ncbi:bacteriohemerythrin [Thauera sp.]|uniref:bacteriohemerythrin n=1 Tax=Thauera sp. TaxID=1905334 RepID=UPI00261D2A97|nr:bacteriohemerythrin [Thauera sp.]
MINEMEIFPWDSNFTTGIAIIDAQHQQLVGLLNRLVRHLAFQSSAPTLNAVFDQLRDYVEVHFTTEEGIWQAHLGEDSAVRSHHESHVDFIEEVLRLKAEESTKPFETVIENIVNFLTRWLALHILEADRRLALVVQGVQHGLTLEQARKEADETMSGAMRIVVETVLAMYDKLANRTMEMTREINRRRQAEAELQQAHEALKRAKENAENVSEAKSSFLASMSHEIRTPLAAVLGMSHLMQQEDLPPTQRQRLDVIENAGKHLLSIVNGILDLSKIEAGKFTLDEAPLDLREVVGEAMAMLAHQAEDKGLSLRAEFDLPAGALLGDATRLRQALVNYLINALKFTAQGGITVRCSASEAGAEAMDLRFVVEDTGPGITPAELRHLFKPFTQGESGAIGEHDGSGLGLAITSRLAELMGGQAGAESEPGRGSRFWFTAHLRKAKADEVEPPSSSPLDIRDALAARHGGRRVLLAEDDKVNREIARVLLSRGGLVPECAADGEEATALAERSAPALILMDMQMPVLDGIAATRKIRAQDWGREVPIIALTANAFAEDRVRCLEAGMDDFLSKPIMPAVLYAKLLYWLDRRSRGQAGA